MLGRLEMDVDECIAAYNELMKVVFEQRLNRSPFDWKLRPKARFDSRTLKSAVEKLLVRKGASAIDKFNDGKERSCRTYVCYTHTSSPC